MVRPFPSVSWSFARISRLRNVSFEPVAKSFIATGRIFEQGIINVPVAILLSREPVSRILYVNISFQQKSEIGVYTTLVLPEIEITPCVV